MEVKSKEEIQVDEAPILNERSLRRKHSQTSYFNYTFDHLKQMNRNWIL